MNNFLKPPPVLVLGQKVTKRNMFTAPSPLMAARPEAPAEAPQAMGRPNMFKNNMFNKSNISRNGMRRFGSAPKIRLF